MTFHKHTCLQGDEAQEGYEHTLHLLVNFILYRLETLTNITDNANIIGIKLGTPQKIELDFSIAKEHL